MKVHAPVSSSPPQSRGSAVSWLISAAVHVGLLALLAMISWVVTRPSEPDLVFSLAPPVAGAAEDGQAGGGSPRAATGTQAPQQAPLAVAAPPSKLLDVPFEMLVPEAPSAAVTGTGDPARTMLQALVDDAEAPDVAGGRGQGGAGSGTGQGFGDYLSGLGARGMDVVLVLDATDSMEPFIVQAKERLHAIMDLVNKLVPGTRFGVVAYKDYGDDYGLDAVKVLPLTDDGDAVRTFINLIVAGGGGDLPEPIDQALLAATDRRRMQWGTRRKQVIILVGDSPVHSTGRQAAYDAAAAFAGRGGTLNVIDVGGAAHVRVQREMVQPDLQIIAQRGKGAAFLLQDTQAFWRHLVTSVFDQRFKADVETIIEQYVREHR